MNHQLTIQSHTCRPREASHSPKNGRIFIRLPWLTSPMRRISWLGKCCETQKKGHNCLKNIGKYHFLLGNWIAVTGFLRGFKLMEINGNLGFVHGFYHGKSPSLTTIWENMFWFTFPIRILSRIPGPRNNQF